MDQNKDMDLCKILQDNQGPVQPVQPATVQPVQPG